MPNVRVLTGVAGLKFAYNRGKVVDQAEFAAAVGSGWERFCEPEKAVKPSVKEAAEKPAAVETATKAPAIETASKRSSKK